MSAPLACALTLPAYFLVFSSGCTEYGLQGQKGTAADDTDLGLDTGSPIDCSFTVAPQATWVGGPTFSESIAPEDESGRSFWEADFDDSAYQPLALPDTSVPPGMDRTYRAPLFLEQVPAGLSLDLQSDDGLWVYVNGTEIGHWGGSWQAEGCVNDNAWCGVTTQVDPVDITPWLNAGENLVAARVSNAIDGAWFELTVICAQAD